MIGPFNSSVARAEIPIINRAHLVQISPANTNQCLTKDIYIPQSLSGVADVDCKAAGVPFPKDLRPTGTNNYFRVATTDDYQGPAMSDYAYKTLNIKKVGVASDAEAYGKGIADTFTIRFQKDGGTVVKRQDFPNASKLLIAAIGRAIKANGGNMPKRQQVLDQMYKTDYTGVLGHTSFDDKGDTTNKVITIYGIKDASKGWDVISSVDLSKGL